MPLWFQTLSVAFMFYAELVAPFFLFGPRWLRRLGFASLALLQVLIAATGNYGFFNLLALVLCLAALDDRDWEALRAVGPWRRRLAGSEEPGRELELSRATDDASDIGQPAPSTGQVPWSWPRRVIVGGVGGILVTVTATQTVETVWPQVEVPVLIQMLGQWLAPLRSTNPYGLFRVMTKERPEITVEGSDDGITWKPYRFRWKPCELDRAPRFAVLHLPRLDWQMWFAALAGNCWSEPWFQRFERRLLAGTPEVLALLRENPFPQHPPRFVRARLARYTFTRFGSKDWWQREELGLFCPEIAGDG
jgi:hypothetical protein